LLASEPVLKLFDTGGSVFSTVTMDAERIDPIGGMTVLTTSGRKNNRVVCKSI